MPHSRIVSQPRVLKSRPFLLSFHEVSREPVATWRYFAALTTPRQCKLSVEFPWRGIVSGQQLLRSTSAKRQAKCTCRWW